MSQAENPKVNLRQTWDKLCPPKEAGPWAEAMHAGVGTMFTQMQASIDRLTDVLNRGITFGNPHNTADLATPEPIRDNVDGQWVTVSITNTNQLGAGAGAPVRFTHGLNHPVNVGGGVANPSLPNVLWLGMRVSHGLKNAPGANPAAVANAIHTSVHFRNGDPVDVNYIDLRVHSGLTPSATEPIVISLFFTRAVV